MSAVKAARLAMIAAGQFDAFVRLNYIARGLLGIAAGMVAHGAVNGEIALSPVSIIGPYDKLWFVPRRAGVLGGCRTTGAHDDGAPEDAAPLCAGLGVTLVKILLA